MTGDLAAQPRGREHLARVAQARGIEGAADQLHGVQVVGVEHFRHVAGLVDTDPVLAGNGAALLEAGVEDRAGHLLGGGHVLVAVVQHERVQVAVSGVENVRDADAGLIG